MRGARQERFPPHLTPLNSMKSSSSNLWLLSINGDPKRVYSRRSAAIYACELFVYRVATKEFGLSEYDSLIFRDTCIRAFTSSNHFFAFGRAFDLSPVLFDD